MTQILEHPTPLLFSIFIVFCTIVVNQMVKKFFQKKIIERATLHEIDPTSFVFINHMATAIIYLFGFGWAMLALPITSTFAHTLLAGAGASTLILGFASQQLFSNLFSGIYLVISRPFKIGDWIEFQDKKGKVIEINLNATLIMDANQNKIIIPSTLILNDKITICPPPINS
jgi:small-conductance mechanosensitive channel